MRCLKRRKEMDERLRCDLLQSPLYGFVQDKWLVWSQDIYAVQMQEHDYSSESVSFAAVLKVFAWIMQNRMEVVTNAMIAAELGISESTVCAAKNVLQHEYENIIKKKVSQKWGDGFRTLGQELAANAWWK